MKIYEGNLAEKLTTTCGTPGFVAPEVFASGAYEGPPVDLFACGVIMFQILTGKMPFYNAGDKWHCLILKDNKKALAARKIDLNSDAADLFVKMTALDPTKRLTVAQVKEHKWFKGPCA